MRERDVELSPGPRTLTPDPRMFVFSGAIAVVMSVGFLPEAGTGDAALGWCLVRHREPAVVDTSWDDALDRSHRPPRDQRRRRRGGGAVVRGRARDAAGGRERAHDPVVRRAEDAPAAA